MKAKSIAPTTSTYNVVIEACSLAQQVDQAMAVYLEMLGSNTPVDQGPSGGGGIGRGRGSSRDCRDATAGPDHLPTCPLVTAYPWVLRTATATATDTATRQGTDMGGAAGIDWWQTTFSLMMRCASLSGRLQHALAVFGEMKAAGVLANRDIYNHLIVACGNAPQPQVRPASAPFVPALGSCPHPPLPRAQAIPTLG
eukprot:691448-Prorocentrum_minimum.AAC.1